MGSNVKRLEDIGGLLSGTMARHLLTLYHMTGIIEFIIFMVIVYRKLSGARAN